MAMVAKSCVGEVFGSLEVVAEYSVKKKNRLVRYVDCVCTCGNKVTTQKGSVKGGTTKSCGCMKEVCGAMQIGDSINHLTLVSNPYKKEGFDYYFGEFLCDCGNTKEISVQNVKGGNTVSCGCIKARNKAEIGSISFVIPRKQDVLEICNQYKAGFSSNVLGGTFGVSNDTILRILKSNGVIIRAKEDQHIRGDNHINRERFSDVACRETAYYYGLLLADGCLNKNEVTLSLKIEDGYMVRGLHKWLNAQTTVYERQRKDRRTGKVYSSVNMHFADKVIAGNLRALGMEERKSGQEVLPLEFKESSDFWRGMLDGDGHISSSTNLVTLCGSEEICKGFVEYCISLGASPTQVVKKVGRISVINLTGFENCKRLLDEVYKDSDLYLIRKYESYQQRYYNMEVTNASN